MQEHKDGSCVTYQPQLFFFLSLSYRNSWKNGERGEPGCIYSRDGSINFNLWEQNYIFILLLFFIYLTVSDSQHHDPLITPTIIIYLFYSYFLFCSKIIRIKKQLGPYKENNWGRDALSITISLNHTLRLQSN